MELQPQRIRNRLPEHDYHQDGIYFITFCTQNKQPILWAQPNPVGERISQPDSVGERSALPSTSMSVSQSLSQYGQIVENGILRIPQSYQSVFVDHYVIMPNHVHLLIRIENPPNRGGSQNLLNRSSNPSLSTIINQLKGAITKQIGKSIWQRSFYDHIIRDDQDYERIWQYIEWNPLKWQEDQYYSSE